MNLTPFLECLYLEAHYQAFVVCGWRGSLFSDSINRLYFKEVMEAEDRMDPMLRALLRRRAGVNKILYPQHYK